MCYEAGGGGDIVAPSFQVRAVSLCKELLPCHILTDGWAGQNNHSNRVLRLPKGLRPARSVSISHIILLVLACLGQHILAHVRLPRVEKKPMNAVCC